MSGAKFHEAITGLISEQLAAGETLRFQVTSSSMAPLLKIGDAVVCEGVASPETFQIGDILVIQRASDFLTHRLIRKSGHRYQTKGDNTLRPDPPVSADAILGRVIRVRHSERSLNLQTGRQQKVASALAKISALEWQAFNINSGLRLPFRLIVKALQQIAIL